MNSPMRKRRRPCATQIARAPGWLDVRPAHPGADDVAAAKLDDAEHAAIALALAVRAELMRS